MRTKTLFLVLVLATTCLWAQEQKQETPPPAGATAAQTPAAPVPHPLVISEADKARKNPVKYTDFSVNNGKRIYTTQCALCHGQKGEGKGDAAVDMKLTMPNFTKPDGLAHRTDGELFAIIGVGIEPSMPSEKGRMSDTQRWNLVNYLRDLSGKVPEKASGNEPEENVILVPQK